MTDRITGGYSLFPDHRPELCKTPFEPCGQARVVECDGGDWDVVECSKCGKQYRARCTFDDDYS